MGTSSALLIGLLALLAGLAVGKAWERYKLKDGVWIDRRRARESPHYMLGLNFLVANQIDQAIDELSKAAQQAGDPLEIHLILGNLYREKGQVGRAIQEHQGLLQRPKLRKLEHANVLLCLGLDYRSGGFVDRAIAAFSEVLKLDPDNRYALSNLEKLYEDQHQWNEAYAMRQRLAALSSTPSGGADSPRHDEVLAFLENEFGQAALKSGDMKEASRRFQAAIERDPRNTPAHLSLGDLSIRQGDTAGAVAAWEKMIESSPGRAYLAFDRLESAYAALGTPERFPALCESLIGGNPQDWRARLALARHLAGRDRPADALELLFQALVHHPHALVLHQAIWQTLSQLQLPPALVARYEDLTRDAIFYLDPHVCLKCRYRSTELLWQCPHCHEWNTFVEERIAPAKDSAEV
ncbi:MAG TPA: tetratricopeptide repeat protein [Vicinamibacterales bacterium]|nr:tetratricopeptide repeat protein [Vicinamibacterales bacterium]